MFLLLLQPLFFNALPLLYSELLKRCDSRLPAICPVLLPLPAPTGFGASGDCTSARSGNDPWAGIFDPPQHTRHSTGPTRNDIVPRRPTSNGNPLCQQIASNTDIRNFHYGIGMTGKILLKAGATYILSWTFDKAVDTITAFSYESTGAYHQVGAAIDIFQHFGTMQVTVPRDLLVQFKFMFEYMFHWQTVDGQIALFQVANGDQNP